MLENYAALTVTNSQLSDQSMTFTDESHRCTRIKPFSIEIQSTAPLAIGTAPERFDYVSDNDDALSVTIEKKHETSETLSKYIEMSANANVNQLATI